MDWIGQHWLDWASLLLIAAGVWWLMPRAAVRPKAIGLILAIAGIALLATRVDDMQSPLGETVLFWLFAGVAIVSGVLMITNRNPVYSALWFAIVTLSVCGLFVLQLAPFLAAATVVVYAGAIVVTFVFVIMLAQQAGATGYDQRSRQPFVAIVATFALLMAIVGTLQYASESAKHKTSVAGESVSALPTGEFVVSAVATPDSSSRDDVANPFSQLPADQLQGQTGRKGQMGGMQALGRSLFGDYLFAVELAGTLLLVATIGAIAIAPRRRGGTL
jgi:NADH-quinone oxidoreductase subunit J